ncbi:MAG: isochorismate synthase [Bacteroidetes bacterium]|nr:isochorismate synthase [Bacteroidota bacterium]
MSNINKNKVFEFLDKNKNRKQLQYIEEISKNNFKLLTQNIYKTENYIYWSNPTDGYKFLAVEGRNVKRINYNLNVIKNVKLKDIVVPNYVGVKKFPSKLKSNEWSDFKSEKWFIPKSIAIQNLDKYYFVINLSSSKKGCDVLINNSEKLFLKVDNIPDHTKTKIKITPKNNYADWKKKIEIILNKIENNIIQKLVLSRRVDATMSGKIKIVDILNKLESENKTSCIYTVKQNDSIYFGATPEKLLSVKNNYLYTEAVAGTIKRGKNKKEDEVFENSLLKSKKNLKEHSDVVKYILEKLKASGIKTNHESKPIIKKIKYLQHLWTPISGKLNGKKEILNIVKTLIPTPAVCGTPQNKTIKTIEKLEQFERGLFCGFIGYINKKNSEFIVPIRSALLNKNKLYAYAGCGVVKGSEAKEEFEETKLKLETILSLFKK